MNALGSFTPGNSFLHHAPAGLKLGVLFFGAITLAVFQGLLATAIALLIVTLLVLGSQIRLRNFWLLLRGFVFLLLVIFVFHAWFSGFEHAFVVVGALLTVIVAASLVTLTTPTWALLDFLSKILRPLRFLGVNAEAVAFAVSLTLRTIPIIFIVARETREAAKARGLERSPRALLIPLLIRSIKHANGLGDALSARGLP